MRLYLSRPDGRWEAHAQEECSAIYLLVFPPGNCQGDWIIFKVTVCSIVLPVWVCADWSRSRVLLLFLENKDFSLIQGCNWAGGGGTCERGPRQNQIHIIIFLIMLQNNTSEGRGAAALLVLTIEFLFDMIWSLRICSHNTDYGILLFKIKFFKPMFHTEAKRSTSWK